MRGDGRVYKRGRIWWVAYYAPDGDGKAIQIRESTNSEDERVAQKLLRDRLRAVANHRSGVRAFAGPKAERLTVADLLDALKHDYESRKIKSIRRTLSHLAPVREFFGDAKAQSLTTEQIRAAITFWTKVDKVSGSTINRRLSILGTAYELAMKEERLTRKPHIPGLPEGKARTGFFEPDQHAVMLANLPSPEREMAQFAYRCGWRQTEIRTLRWENVDRAAREVKLPDSKNGLPRTLPMDDELAALFDLLWGRRTYTSRGQHGISEYVFHRRGRPVGHSYFSRMWRKAVAKGGEIVEGRTFHDYRRTAVRNLVRAGVPQSVAMSITGHESDAVFRRYNITSNADRIDAMRKQKLYLDGVNEAEAKENGDKVEHNPGPRRVESSS